MALNREIIVAEAVALLKEHGLAQLSLRNVAGRLSVKAPALARHVGNKDSLTALMAEAIFRSGYERMPACDTWQDWLRAFGRALWEVQTDIRDSALIISVAPLEPGVLDGVVTDLKEAMLAYHLNEQTGARMQSSVQALVSGWMLYRHSQKAEWLDALIGIEESFYQSLDALIAGWERFAAKAPAAANSGRSVSLS